MDSHDANPPAGRPWSANSVLGRVHREDSLRKGCYEHG